jgi:hypothetical protein
VGEGTSEGVMGGGNIGAEGQSSPASRVLKSGIPIKKKIYPKSKTGKLFKSEWKKSFGKLSSGGKKVT